MSYKHGFAREGKVERLHNIWRGMLKRCSGTIGRNLKDYSGRGINVCLEWRTDYTAFREWAIANGYQPDFTIERNDNDGPYSPNNCSWIPIKDQARNRRNSRLITFEGETKTLAEWSEIKSIPYATLVARINVYHWPIEKAFSEPVTKAAQYLVGDAIYTIHELAEKYSVKEATLRYRLKHMDLEKALNEKECRGKWRKPK